MNKRISCLLVLVSMLLVFCHEDILYAKSDGGTLLKDLYLKDEDQDIISSDEMLIQKNLVSLNQKIMSEMMTVDCAGEGENPGIGFDEYGNIYLDNNDQFPVLMGGWNFRTSGIGEEPQYTTVTNPLNIVFR